MVSHLEHDAVHRHLDILPVILWKSCVLLLQVVFQKQTCTLPNLQCTIRLSACKHSHALMLGCPGRITLGVSLGSCKASEVTHLYRQAVAL